MTRNGSITLLQRRSVIDKPKFHLLRHITTRHDTLSSPCILVQEKVVRAVSSMLYSKRDTARHDERHRRDTQLCS